MILRYCKREWEQTFHPGKTQHLRLKSLLLWLLLLLLLLFLILLLLLLVLLLLLLLKLLLLLLFVTVTSHIFHIIGTLLDRNYIINLNIIINTFIMYLKIYFSTKNVTKISS